MKDALADRGFKGVKLGQARQTEWSGKKLIVDSARRSVEDFQDFPRDKLNLTFSCFGIEDALDKLQVFLPLAQPASTSLDGELKGKNERHKRHMFDSVAQLNKSPWACLILKPY